MGCRRLVITIESQLHGYRQGHELLASSIVLPKADQSIIDRLSDISGPLRAGEIFKPYLSGYPLPSGAYYVLARTWQDLTVQRAGCVRTLSFLIPIEKWSSALSIESFYALLKLNDLPSRAEQVVLEELLQQPLPPVENFQGSELLEALFLEDSKPVALIDAADPELIALRLVTALWPSLRRNFSLSTFALSPRRIEGRDFDLVFVPKNARSRFADWPGRRVDGRATNSGRHRWTHYLVERVFHEPAPRLLSDSELGLVGLQEPESSAAIRIALLWDELMTKLESSPFALLGLVDIVNSRKQAAPSALSSLRMLLGETASRAVSTLSEAEAWQFIGAITRKVHGTPLESEMNVLASAAGILAAASPEGAVSLLNEPDSSDAIVELLPEIADGLGKKFSPKTEVALLSAFPSTLIRLIAAGGSWLESALKLPILIQYFGEVLSLCAPEDIASVKKVILFYLVDNSQVKIAQSIFKTFDTKELLQEVSFLAETNEFSADSFIPLLTERAFQLDVISLLRSQLLSLDDFSLCDKFIFSTLSSSIDDINWLLSDSQLSKQKAKKFLIDVLRAANLNQREEIFKQESLCVKILDVICNDAGDITLSIFKEGRLPINSYMDTAIWLLDVVEADARIDIAFSALNRGLSERFSESETDTLSMFLGEVGKVLNGAWAVQKGLDGFLSKDILSRNLIVFNQSPKAARIRIVEAVEFLAKSISARYELDITSEAAGALAAILLDSQKINTQALNSTSSQILQPLLFRSTLHPVSKILSATFPIVYKELADYDHDYILDALKFIPFLIWDKRKAARSELVAAFLKSAIWAPEDLLITACLCNAEEKVVEKVRKSPGGLAYIEKLKACISRIPSQFRNRASSVLSEV